MTSSLSKQFNNLAGLSSDANYTIGTVLGIDGNMAEVVSAQLGQIKVRIDITRGRSGIPKVGDVWFLDQSMGQWLFAALYASVPAWKPAILLNAWTNLDPPGTWTPGVILRAQAGYYRDEIGWVHLRGGIHGGAITTFDSASPNTADICQLPVGYRPSMVGKLMFAVSSNNAYGQVSVYPDGTVRATAGSPVTFFLSGVRFLAEG